MKRIISAIFIATNLLFAKGGIVVLDPSAIEIFFALGAQDKIVAISETESETLYPSKEIKKLPSVGNYAKPNLEKIVELQPDLVITGLFSSSISPELEKFKIKSINVRSLNIEGMYANITKIAKIVDKIKEGKKLIKNIKDKANSLDFSKIKGKKIIFFAEFANNMAFGKNSLTGQALEFMQLDNLALKLKGRRPIVSSEFILQENPDFILVATKMNLDEYLQNVPTFKHLKAYKNNKIFIYDVWKLGRGTPRLMKHIEELYKKMIQ